MSENTQSELPSLSAATKVDAQAWSLPLDAFAAPEPAAKPADIVLPHAIFECYFLLGAQSEWLRLWPHCRYTIGSSPACEVMINEPELSSRHALIEFRDGRPHLCDLSSATGTFVDGLPIYDHPLADGDCIQLGPREFRFLAGEESRLVAELIAAQGDKSFSGNLTDTPIVDVLQFMHATRKSGALSIVADGAVSVIEFHEGSIRFAEMGGDSGPEAIYKLLTLKAGRFVFSTAAGTRVFRRNISESTPFLIMEAARRMDESESCA